MCCSTPGWDSTWMGDCLRAGKPSWYVTSRLGQLSLPFLRHLRSIRFEFYLLSCGPNIFSKNTKFGAKSPPFCRNFKRKIEILNIHNFSVRNLHRKIPTSCPLPIFSTHDATAPKRALNGLCTSSSWIQLMKISDKKLLQSAAKMQITGSSI